MTEEGKAKKYKRGDKVCTEGSGRQGRDKGRHGRGDGREAEGSSDLNHITTQVVYEITPHYHTHASLMWTYMYTYTIIVWWSD